MRLLHYSKAPLGEIVSKEQEDVGLCRAFVKPRGLWVSVEGEDDWASWCASEQFGRGHIENEVTLKPDHNVLILRNAGDILAFTKEFEDVEAEEFLRGINWGRVAARYDGIIIAPYIWGCRHHEGTRWYYGWDCASGCIWNAEAVAEVKQIQTEKEASGNEIEQTSRA